MVEEDLDFEVESDPGTDPQENNPRELQKSKIPAWLGFLGLILGATGIILALMARGDLSEFRDELNSGPDPLPGLQVELDALKDNLAALDRDLAISNSRLETIVNQTQRAFEDVMREVKANRVEINKNGKLLGEMGQRIFSLENEKSGPGPIRTQSAAPSAPSTPAEKPADGYHIIESGDSFDKLAKQYGTTIEAFMNSNPGLDPRRLQIGQQVKIPE